MREGVNGHLLHVLLPHLGLGISSPRLLLQGAVRGPFSSNTVTGGSVYGCIWNVLQEASHDRDKSC